MNKKKRFIGLMILCIGIAGCNSNKKTTNEVNPKSETADISNINRVWMLVQFNDFTKEYLTQKGAFLDLKNAESAAANMGCNSISFQVDILPKNKILFSKGIMTQMACEDMKLEDKFARELPQYSTYSIDGHKLILTTSKGEKMMFVAQDWD